MLSRRSRSVSERVAHLQSRGRTLFDVGDAAERAEPAGSLISLRDAIRLVCVISSRASRTLRHSLARNCLRASSLCVLHTIAAGSIVPSGFTVVLVTLPRFQELDAPVCFYELRSVHTTLATRTRLIHGLQCGGSASPDTEVARSDLERDDRPPPTYKTTAALEWLQLVSCRTRAPASYSAART